jgi:hypothetical protein
LSNFILSKILKTYEKPQKTKNQRPKCQETNLWKMSKDKMSKDKMSKDNVPKNKTSMGSRSNIHISTDFYV